MLPYFIIAGDDAQPETSKIARQARIRIQMLCLSNSRGTSKKYYIKTKFKSISSPRAPHTVSIQVFITHRGWFKSQCFGTYNMSHNISFATYIDI